MKHLTPFYAACLCAPAFLTLTLAALFSCTATEAPDFIGKWAAEYPSRGPVVMEFRENHSTLFVAYNNGELISSAVGDWAYRDPRLLIYHYRCQSGSPPAAVACPTPDTLYPADISSRDGSWQINLTDSTKIITLVFRRTQ
jgi:hypothetical protein